MKRLVIVLALVLSFMFAASVASAGKIEDVKAAGVLVCGVKDSVNLFGFIDPDTKDLVGFDVDVCKYIASKLGVKTEFKVVTSKNRIPMLAQGSVDILAATMTHKFSRDEQIDFSITYFMDGQKLLVKKGSGILSTDDLVNKKVGTVKGSTSEKNIKAAQPKAQVISYDEYPQAFMALKQGKVKAVTTDSGILAGLKAGDDNPDNWEIVGEFFSSEPYGLGVPSNDSAFRDFVNKALNEMWLDGSYQKTFKKWMGYDLPAGWSIEIWPM
ncbi:ABC transporter substrate-binding protein [Pseudodesulfovibrio piezophilus]|uniref:ABC transporter glutamine-binding protein glnH n=1 Tax=Pseudodesulfovibrio piezophilus (strain DSM 21447 / JCM 15486 / C1TLV30) TaxID=1322246 RepID=M1WQS2_PSEP2|nr:ABC transporter substrate-binding protein [Pseudodesulfovibrio piezophilus]CCH47847.1 ABC transporter glutamine-binding protein glnH [Pseudodesulfovibrio piezophilus C1TLV30]